MSPLFKLFGFILLVILALIGFVGNGFIVIVNGTDWFRSRKLSPANMILGSLSLFRLAFIAVVIQTAVLKFFVHYTVLILNLKIACDVLWLFVKTADLWFAAWLSVLYCVKIANFFHPLFLRMKRRIPGLVPWLLLGTVVYSAITTIIAMTGETMISNCISYESLLSNNSGNKPANFCKYFLLLILVPDLVPFVIFLISSILLLTSLWRHKKMLQNSARDVSTEVHLNAIKALASFSILYVFSFCVGISDLLLTLMYIEDLWLAIIAFNVIVAYSSGHAFILIFMNPKLKQEAVRILHQLKSCMKTPS